MVDLFTTGRVMVAACMSSAVLLACADDGESHISPRSDEGGADGSGGATASTQVASTVATSSASSGGEGGEGGAGGSAFVAPQAGIVECDDLFRTEDGTCAPDLDACEPGDIPSLSDGCIPVGPTSCDAAFVSDEGFCLPSSDTCEEGYYPVPSEGCVPIDGADGCGKGTWGALVDSAGDLHVDPSSQASEASDGSRAHPFLSIAEALEQATDDSRIVLAAGTYDEPVLLEDRSRVSIVGRCASMVELVGRTVHGNAFLDMPTAAVVAKRSGPLELEGVRLAGPGVGLFALDTDADLENVEVESFEVGVSIVGHGVLNADHVWIHDVKPGTDSGQSLGFSLDGGESTIRASAVTRVSSAGIGVYGFDDAAVLTVEDSFVEDVAGDVQFWGLGILLNDSGAGASVVATDTVVSRAEGGVYVYGGELQLVRSGVFESRQVDWGAGVLAANRAEVSVRRSVIVESATAGIHLSNSDATSVENLIANNRGSYWPQDGVRVHDGSRLTSVGDVIVANEGVGVLVSLSAPGAPPASASVVGALVQGHLRKDTGPAGYGVLVGGGTSATFNGCTFRDNARAGLVAASSWTLGPVAPVTLGVESCRVEADGGLGVQLVGEVTASVERALVLGSGGAGVHVLGAALSLTDCVVRDVEPTGVEAELGDLVSEEGGDAILVQAFQAIGSMPAEDFSPGATIRGALVEGAARAGVLVDASSVTMSASRVAQSRFGVIEQNEGSAAVDACEFSDIAESAPEGGLPVP